MALTDAKKEAIRHQAIRDSYEPMFAALDAIENLLEYAKKDIIDSELVTLTETYQEGLIGRRSDLIDEMQAKLNESTQAVSGANNHGSD